MISDTSINLQNIIGGQYKVIQSIYFEFKAVKW